MQRKTSVRKESDSGCEAARRHVGGLVTATARRRQCRGVTARRRDGAAARRRRRPGKKESNGDGTSTTATARCRRGDGAGRKPKMGRSKGHLQGRKNQQER